MDDAEVQKRVDEALQRVKDSNQFMLSKGTLILTVTLKTIEDAEQIMEWMYSDKKPMTAELTNIAWDQEPIRSDIVKALNNLVRIMGGEKYDDD